MIARSDEEAQGGRLRARRVVHVVDKDDAAYAAKIGTAIALAERYRTSTDVLERGRLLRAIDTASRRATGVAKAAAAAAFVRGLIEAGERVLVFAHHHDVYDILEDHLGQLEPALLTGRQTPTEKAEHKRRWVDGETSLAFLALRGSAGLDGMQQRGSVMVFVELDWSPQVHTQCEGRLSARYGLDETLTDLLAYYLVTDTGHDETMQEALGLKVAEYSGLLGLTPEGEEERVLAEQAAERQLDRVIARLQDESHRRTTRRAMPSEAEIDALATDPGLLGAA
ncbi:MAG: hypothetical protein H3C62_01075 [Gemmatimonadaceae bacterium]|nr:hypothetical protein [Gemmatimonadaceae bacterium]